jgi:Predicted acetyltransferase
MSEAGSAVLPDGGKVTIRHARREDLPALVALFAADSLGGHGDTSDPVAAGDYLAAFEEIERSPNDRLYVAELAGEVAGTFQTTLTRTLTGRGSLKMTVEAVQTRADLRGRGIGAAMIRFAIEEARRAGARQVQLMSNAVRVDAHRFYERLGFAKSHVGFKLKL